MFNVLINVLLWSLECSFALLFLFSITRTRSIQYESNYIVNFMDSLAVFQNWINELTEENIKTVASQIKESVFYQSESFSTLLHEIICCVAIRSKKTKLYADLVLELIDTDSKLDELVDDAR